ncbi:MAG: glycosyltransferase family 9 protein [Bacteroidales bacterium]|nr:glycosyltransferase family 9 protein [Bacteroidales bacterium]
MQTTEKKINHIALCRTDAIGDCIMTLPMCGILKERFPQSKLSFIASSYTEDIIKSDTDVDEFINYTTLTSLTENEQIEFLKKKNIDVIIFVFPNKHLAKISKKAKIPCRIATSHRPYNWLYCNKLVNFSRKKSNLNEAQLNTKLLKPLGTEEDFSMAKLTDYLHIRLNHTQFEAKTLLKPDKINVILHPKSRGSAREWPKEYYQKLIELLDGRFRIFICGTPKEMEGISFKGDNVISLVGKMSLKEYIEFISLSDFLVACSTGPLHIAAITGIHAVGLYPPMKNINPQRWHPLGKNVKVFSYDNPTCIDCKKSSPCHCMLKLEPTQVAEYICKTAFKQK